MATVLGPFQEHRRGGEHAQHVSTPGQGVLQFALSMYPAKALHSKCLAVYPELKLIMRIEK